MARPDDAGTARLAELDEELSGLVRRRARLAAAAEAASLAVEEMDEESLRIQSDERELRAAERAARRRLKEGIDDEKERSGVEYERYLAKSRIADLMSELQEGHNEIHALRNNLDLRLQELAELDEAHPAADVERAREAQRHIDALPDDERRRFLAGR